MNIKLLSLLLLIPVYLGAMDSKSPAQINDDEKQIEQNKIDQLVRAAQKSDTAAIEELLNQGVDPDGKNCFGDNALTHATYNGDIIIIRRLLVAGANPDCVDSDGLTPVMIACTESAGHTLNSAVRDEILTQLSCFGADFKIKNKSGLKFLPEQVKNAANYNRYGFINAIIGLYSSNEKIYAKILKKFDINLLFWAAVIKDQDYIAEYMLCLGADPNAYPAAIVKHIIYQNSTHQAAEAATPLAFAESSTSIRMRKLLFSYGANPNLKVNGFYHLHGLASAHYHLKTPDNFLVKNLQKIKMMLEYGANPLLVDTWGNTAFDCIAKDEKEAPQLTKLFKERRKLV